MEDLRTFYKKAIYVFEHAEEKNDYNKGYIDGLKFALDACEKYYSDLERKQN